MSLEKLLTTCLTTIENVTLFKTAFIYHLSEHKILMIFPRAFADSVVLPIGKECFASCLPCLPPSTDSPSLTCTPTDSPSARQHTRKVASLTLFYRIYCETQHFPDQKLSSSIFTCCRSFVRPASVTSPLRGANRHQICSFF